MLLFWIVLWPVIWFICLVVVVAMIQNTNKHRVGWAQSPIHPTFGLVMKNGQAFVALQLQEKQFLFDNDDDLEKLLQDGLKQRERAMTMAAVLDDSILKSEMERELESL